MITQTSTALKHTAPTLWVCLDDYKIPVAVPTLDMTERFLAKAKIVAELQNGLTPTAYDDIFELFAEVLSCNHNYIRYTAEDLKAKNITVDQIVGVLTDWTNFIGAIAQLKN